MLADNAYCNNHKDTLTKMLENNVGTPIMKPGYSIKSDAQLYIAYWVLKQAWKADYANFKSAIAT